MSEAIIARRGGKAKEENIANYSLYTEIIDTDKSWVVPSNVYANMFSVRIFGAGGGGNGKFCGGGGGWMNNADLTLTPGEIINIIIGKGSRRNGGSTTFGTYLSANGGGCPNATKAGSGGSGGGGGDFNGNLWNGGDGYQFGGGGIRFVDHQNSKVILGGNGGIWGGGGGVSFMGIHSSVAGKAGDGGMYGGGGGADDHRGFTNDTEYSSSAKYSGGNGGTYGGGGGATKGTAGKGGTYGGNGGNGVTEAENGINTYLWTNVLSDGTSLLRGYGRAGNATVFSDENRGGGGGGFGGSGGDGSGGGGGYGGDGGSVAANDSGGCGGGGFGGPGGTWGGGGGGYGRSAFGGDAGGGGGGYFSQGGNGGGGGSYGRGAESVPLQGMILPEYGGGGWFDTNGANGICIIQYYTKVI